MIINPCSVEYYSSLGIGVVAQTTGCAYVIKKVVFCRICVSSLRKVNKRTCYNGKYYHYYIFCKMPTEYRIEEFMLVTAEYMTSYCRMLLILKGIAF